MARTWRRAAAVVAVVVLGGCATAAPPSGPATEPPLGQPGGQGQVDPVPPVGGSDVTFTACARQPAEPSTTNLRPNDLTAADRASVGDLAEQVPDGRLVLEHATELVIADGEVGFGNGYEAATAGVPALVVADSTVTASVTQLVLDSPSSGRRVAFVEVRLSPEPPVRWAEEPQLGFVTDGGDGGVVATGRAPVVDHGTDLGFVEDYIDAFYPGGDSASGHVCVLRAAGGTVDAVLFSAGWGDGHYPTYVGYGADGDVVSLVSHGWVVPWALSGLPGEPPSIPGEAGVG